MLFFILWFAFLGLLNVVSRQKFVRQDVAITHKSNAIMKPGDLTTARLAYVTNSFVIFKENLMALFTLGTFVHSGRSNLLDRPVF